MEGYTPPEVKQEAEKFNQTAEVQNVAVETEQVETPRQGWLDFLYAPLTTYDTNLLEAGQAVLNQHLQNKDISLSEMQLVHIADYNVGLELLRRKNPKASSLCQ